MFFPGSFKDFSLQTDISCKLCHKLCGSIKYPYSPMEGTWKFLGGGGGGGEGGLKSQTFRRKV